MKNSITKAIIGASLALPMFAQAAVIDLDLTQYDSRENGNGSYATANLYSPGGVSLRVAAYTEDDGDQIVSTSLGTFGGGLGAETGSDPQHTIDNIGNRYDMVLLTFGEEVSLSKISLGYINGDSDVSILYDDGVTGVSSMWSQLIGNGWASGGDYVNLNTGSNAVNSSEAYSNRWLIGAYNPVFNGVQNPAITANNDAFKLSGLRFSTFVAPEPVDPPTAEVPEPTNIALLVLGSLALVSARRRANS